ncbi:hypothetical protein, partial [Streptomyces sp. NPDC051576]|uniref:hypothetical protein n=1 Tax=Streptomyces sp. NPDC051576 TaxID=3155803 RepID=UPI003438EFD5
MCSGVVDGAGTGSEDPAGPCATGDGLLGAPATVPVPAVTLGLGDGAAGALVLLDGVGPDDALAALGRRICDAIRRCAPGSWTVP